MSEIKLLNFIVGDIHGCYDELLELEDQFAFDSIKYGCEYRVISVGDLIDRGPKSKQVVEHFYQGQVEGSHKAVLGNHEYFFLQYMYVANAKWLRSKKIKIPMHFYSTNEMYMDHPRTKGLPESDFPALIKSIWLSQGGYEMLKSYGIDSKKPDLKKLPEKHVKYLFNLPLFIEDENFIVTHALATHTDFKLLKKTFQSTHLNISKEVKKACSNIVWNRNHQSVNKFGQKLMISGHTPYKNPRKNTLKNTLQIDTKCFKNGKLTAYCPELNRYYSVNAKETYYFKGKSNSSS